MPHTPRSTFARAVSARAPLAAALLVALAGGACVTERTTRTQWGAPREGVPLKGAPARPAHLSTSAHAPRPGTAPVAAPARDAAQRSASARVSLAPLGEVPYDGQTLPILSPDGLFLATRVLDEPRSGPGQGNDAPSHIELYPLTPPPLGPPLRIMPPEPRASMLAMASSSEAHFLICEREEPDQPCRFSLVAWGDGIQTPLGDEPEVFAPSLPPVMLVRAGSAMALAVLEATDPAEMRTILDVGSARDADQIAQTLTSHTDPPGVPMPRGPFAMVYHSERRRMIAVDLVSEATLDLAEGSVNGCFDPAPLASPGSIRVYVCTSQALLEQTIDFSSGEPHVSPPRTIWPEPVVPRATSNPERPFILFAPDGSSDARGTTPAPDPQAPPRLRVFAFDPEP